MKFIKIILVILWIISTTLFVVGALTPLEFRSSIIAYVCFFIAFNGVFSLRFLLTSFISLKTDKVIIVFLISVILAVTYTYLPGVKEDWKTQEIMYRERDKEDNVIAFQMVSKGGANYDHRIVKMLRVTPFFDYVIEIPKVKVGDDWIKVNEFVNEMHIAQDSSKIKNN
jgi:hypothetical protein